jgi:hypothetical protein
LLAVAAGAVAAAVEVGAVVFAVVELLGAAAAAAAVVAVVATFLADAFLAGEAECFRFVPVADFGLLDDELAFVVFAALGVFERLRDFVVEDFFVVDVFFFPAAEPFFAVPADECNLKLPVAPTPFVCFKDLFPVPVRKADLRCLLAVVELTLKLADDVVCDVLSDVGPLRSVILFDLRNECGYEYEAKKKKKKL